MRLPADLYATIVQSVPILCVDLIIRSPYGTPGRYLTVLRKNEPLEGVSWVPGGRVMREEEVREAAIRLARDEVGLPIIEARAVGYYEDVFPKSAANPKGGIHTLSIVFECRATSENVVLDSQSGSYEWSESVPERFLTNLRRF